MLRFVLLLIVVMRTGACPNLCKCSDFPQDDKNLIYFTLVTCYGYEDNLVQSLSNTTHDLMINNLNEHELYYFVESLQEENIPSLRSVVISESIVDNYTFVLDNLELTSFSVVCNRLTSVPEISQNRSSLRILDLSRNAINALASDPFRTLRTLEVLNLSANSLTTIASDSLTGLVNLKCLDLSGNNLTALDDKVLLPVTNLQYLNLSSNQLEVLNEVSFGGLVKLQQLDVSWNRLARVAPGTLELPSLARLLLAGNPALGGSREVLVGTGRRLQTVDASRTGLKQVPAALTHSIRTLRLAGNSITIVRCGDLDSYPLLQLLDFSSNELLSIEDDALGRLESLSILYLTDNDIYDIPKSLPEQLKVLHLEHNDLKKVAEDDLQGLSALEVLLLSDNKIRIVEEGAFRQMNSLVTLDLSRNPVTFLQPGCLSGPPALQVLRLSSIGIILPAEDVSFPLTAPEHLISLDLSSSPGLARQFLADTAALAASRALQELDISRVGLQIIRSDLLHFLPQLRVFHVNENRLNCTDLHWLACWMRRQDSAENRKIVCETPTDLRGTALVDLPDLPEIKIQESPTQSITRKENTVDLKEPVKYTKENVSNENNVTNLSIQDLDKIDIRKKIIHFILQNNNVTKINDSNKAEKNTLKHTETNDNLINTTQSVNNEKKENKTKTELIGEKTIFVQDLSFDIINKTVNKSKQINPLKREKTENKSFKKILNENKQTQSLKSVNKEILKLANKNLAKEHFLSQQILEDFITENQLLGIQNVTASYELGDFLVRSHKLDNSQLTKPPRKQMKINHAITVTAETSTFRPSDRSHLQSDANESHKSLTNKPSVDSLKVDIKLSREHSLGVVNLTDGTWNTSNLAMYTTDPKENYIHPGILIVGVSLLAIIAVLAMLAARLTQQRREARLTREDDIEVSSLPGVTELW